MSLAEQVRQVLAEVGEATSRQVADRLEVANCDRKRRRRIQSTLNDLVRGGLAVARKGPAGFCWRLTEKAAGRPVGRCLKQDQLWRAIRIHGTGFSVRQVALLAEANPDYAKRYVRFLVQIGWLEKKERQRGAAGIYRLAPGRGKGPAPRFNRRQLEREGRGTREAGEVLDDMERVLLAISGEALLLKGFLGELRQAVTGKEAEGGPEGADQS